MKTNKSFCNYGKNLICFVLTLFMAMPVFPSSQDEEDIKGPSHFSTVRTDSSQTQRRSRSDSEASSDGGRSMHETKNGRTHRGLSDDALFGRRPSDDSVSSSTHSSGLHYSQTSEAAFENFTFLNYLLRANKLQEYRAHRMDAAAIRSRKLMRNEFLAEVDVYIDSIYEIGDSIVLDSAPSMTAFLKLVHRHAINAYAENLFQGQEYLASIGTYRHTFCKRYIQKLKTLVPYSSPIHDLQLEPIYYLNTGPLPDRVDGCVIPDVYWQNRGIVFDYKNFGGTVTDIERTAWAANVTDFIRAIAIEEGS